MDYHINDVKRPSEETLGTQVLLHEAMQEQTRPPRKKIRQLLFTRRGALFAGLALLIVVASLGGILLALRTNVKWSHQFGNRFYPRFSPIVANGVVYTLDGGLVN